MTSRRLRVGGGRVLGSSLDTFTLALLTAVLPDLLRIFPLSARSAALVGGVATVGLAGAWLLPDRPTRIAPAWLAVVPTLALGFYVTPFGSIPYAWLVLLGLAVVLVWLAWRWPALGAVGLVSTGLGLRLLHFAQSPIDPRRADMLPLVDQALTRLLDGHGPYATYAMPWPLPLTYLPVTWMAYLPAKITGIDLRWTNVFSEMVVALAFVWLVRRSAAGRAMLAAWGLWFLSPTIVAADGATTAPVQWAALVWLLALTARSDRRADAALGVALATTPLALPFVPLIVVRWVHERGPRSTSVGLVRAALVASLLVVPWVLPSPRDFLEGTVLWFNDLERYPREKWIQAKSWAKVMGLSGLFWTWGLERWLKPIQVALVGGIAWSFARAKEAPVSFPRWAAATFLVFMVLNPVLWVYLYVPATIAAFVALAEREDRLAAHRPKAVRAP